MNELIFLSIYLIGISIMFAIVEGDLSLETTVILSMLWPITTLFIILIISLYPFYWITKQIKNKIKH